MPNLAYLIMPVGSDEAFDSKRAAIEAASLRLGWLTHFPFDYMARKDHQQDSAAEFRLPQVIADMQTAALIFADLSLERPSCYYELGIAQALGRPTFVVAATGTAIHQVADRNSVSFYANLEELSHLVSATLSEYSG